VRLRSCAFLAQTIDPTTNPSEENMSLTSTRSTSKSVSLGEFVKRLILDLEEKSVTMPFQNEENWHNLFYKLKSARAEKGRPLFFEKLRFDWDGPYPRCQDLSEYLQTLHLNGFISVSNPSYDKLSVDDDVMNGVEKVRPPIDDEALESFLRYSAKEAKQLFG
jgi:hypothetical protein